MRALSALAAASRTEDRYGVVLLCNPHLADVTIALLSATAALQTYTRLVVRGRPDPRFALPAALKSSSVLLLLLLLPKCCKCSPCCLMSAHHASCMPAELKHAPSCDVSLGCRAP